MHVSGSVSFLVGASFTTTYRATSPAIGAIRLYRRFKEYRRLRSEVNRYTSSAGSFIILQGINLVSVRAEGEGGYLFGHVCTALSVAGKISPLAKLSGEKE